MNMAGKPSLMISMPQNQRILDNNKIIIFCLELILLAPLFSNFANAQSSIFRTCMERAEAIKTTAQLRDSGMNMAEYRKKFTELYGHPPGPAENDIIVPVFVGAKNYSPNKLYDIATRGCIRNYGGTNR